MNAMEKRTCCAAGNPAKLCLLFGLLEEDAPDKFQYEPYNETRPF
jgi:hypothetical protein